MKIKFLVGALVFLVVVNLAVMGTFIAMNLSRKPAPKGEWGPKAALEGERRVRRPRIPDERRRELMVHLRDLRRETAPLKERIAGLEEEIFVAMQEDPVSEARVDSLLEEISGIQYEISRIAARKLIDAKRVLPPGEREAFFRAVLGGERHLGRMGPRGERPHRETRSRRTSPDSVPR